MALMSLQRFIIKTNSESIMPQVCLKGKRPCLAFILLRASLAKIEMVYYKSSNYITLKFT